MTYEVVSERTNCAGTFFEPAKSGKESAGPDGTSTLPRTVTWIEKTVICPAGLDSVESPERENEKGRSRRRWLLDFEG